MYIVSLLPGDYLWGADCLHKCDENGFVKINECFQNIHVEEKEDYIRIKNKLFEERIKNGLISMHSLSNLWLLNRPTEFGYQASSFIVQSSFSNIYELKSDLEKCCNHIGILADTVCFDPIEYIPSKTPRTKIITVKEPLVHSYSNEKIEEYTIWDDNTQEYVFKREISYFLNSSNITKKIPVSYINQDNVTVTEIREVPVMILKETVEYEFDPLDSSKILYDIDYNNLQPKYPIKYLSHDGQEISENIYKSDPTNNYCAMYVPYIKLKCDCNE